MSELIEKIKTLSEEYFDDIKEIRRHIHSNPELSFEEYNTATFIEEKLAEIGLQNIQRIAKTGVTFCLEGNKKGKTIALRADTDALPITEKNEISYQSKNEGVMHACGHDAHTASLLGAAKILHELKDEWNGTVKFIFNPQRKSLQGELRFSLKKEF